MSDTSWIRPRIAVSNPEQLNQIHEQSLHILASVGIRVDAPWAREALSRAASTRVRADGTVRLPRDLIAWAIEAAPRRVNIYDRQGTLAFRIGEDQARFGAGVTTLAYQDPATGDLEQFARRHMETAVRLGDALHEFDIVSTLGIVQDVAPELSDLYATLDMLANTVKPLVLLVSGEERFPAVLDLIEHLTGELSSRPSVIPYVNPITPLVLNAGTADKMRHAIRRGLPLIFSSYGMAGATTPISPPAAWALLHAELLAGLTLAQLTAEGTPVILGMLPAYFDMRGTGSSYDMTSYLLNLACAEMMEWLGLPHCGTSGSGMGWGPDLLTAGHQWANHLTSCAGKAGLVPFVGDILGSKAFSPAAMVYANDVIAHARRFARGFPMDESHAELHEITSVGPGGSFLTTESTLAQFRTACLYSDILPNLTLEEWRDQGQPNTADRLREHTIQRIANLAPPPHHDLTITQGESFIRTLGPVSN
jgi:trimethylamine:corrinoid methyltransferase-like protein